MPPASPDSRIIARAYDYQSASADLSSSVVHHLIGMPIFKFELLSPTEISD